MTYHQFVQAVESKMKEVVKEDIAISVYTAKKNNGVKRQGITISQKGINISPTIYLEEYFEYFLNGWTLDHVVSDIVRLYQEVRLQKSWQEEKISSYESVEKRIIYRLVNYEANEELLKDVPHVPYLDLAIIFHVLLEVNDCGTACMLIKNEHLEMWKVSADEIYERARVNTWRLLPSEFRTMREMMEELEGKGTFDGRVSLYVLTNKIQSFGAAAILYEGCLEMIGEYLNDNYYVLPSSIHEVLIVAEKETPWSKLGLNDIVSEVNRTQVDAEEVLSDCAYYYDREEKKLR